MPLGVVTTDEFESELSNCTNGLVRDSTKRGRGDGNKEVPDGLRKIIGEEPAREDSLEIARSFGISDSSVSAYRNGTKSTATYNTPDTDLLSHINNHKTKIGKRAIRKLSRTLHHLTDEKLAEAKPSELAIVARSMAAIVKDMEPTQVKETENNKGPSIVIYAPQVISENKLPVITVNE